MLDWIVHSISFGTLKCRNSSFLPVNAPASVISIDLVGLLLTRYAAVDNALTKNFYVRRELLNILVALSDECPIHPLCYTVLLGSMRTDFLVPHSIFHQLATEGCVSEFSSVTRSFNMIFLCQNCSLMCKIQEIM